MRRTPSLLSVPLLLVVFAGCTSPGPADDNGDSEPPTSDSYRLTAEDMPSLVSAGENFTYTLIIEGEPEWTSDHIGGHFGNTSTDQPSTAVYTGACFHAPTLREVPDTFEITCRINEPGTWYLRGHMRIALDDGQVLNWWTDEEFTIVAA